MEFVNLSVFVVTFDIGFILNDLRRLGVRFKCGFSLDHISMPTNTGHLDSGAINHPVILPRSVRSVL